MGVKTGIMIVMEVMYKSLVYLGKSASAEFYNVEEEIMKQTFDTDRMYNVIISLMCLDDESEYHIQTFQNELVIKFKGDKGEVRNRVFEWLQNRKLDDLRF